MESFPKPGQPSGTKATTEPPCQLSTAASCALSAGLVVSNHLWKSWDGGWEHQLCQPKMDIYLLVVWACTTVVITQIWINHETWGDLAKFVGLSPPNSTKIWNSYHPKRNDMKRQTMLGSAMPEITPAACRIHKPVGCVGWHLSDLNHKRFRIWNHFEVTLRWFT